MDSLQQTGGVNQGSSSSSFQNSNSALQPTGQLQGSGTESNVLGVSSVLAQSNSSAQVTVEGTSSGTTSSSQVTPLTTSGFSVSPWWIILAGAMVIIAGISFIWSQRNDMSRI